MEAASALIDGLGDEEKRWKEERIEFAQKVDRSDTYPHASIYLDNIKYGNPIVCVAIIMYAFCDICNNVTALLSGAYESTLH